MCTIECEAFPTLSNEETTKTLENIKLAVSNKLALLKCKISDLSSTILYKEKKTPNHAYPVITLANHLRIICEFSVDAPPMLPGSLGCHIYARDEHTRRLVLQAIDELEQELARKIPRIFFLS